jgi:hypothetical protein
MNFQLNHFRRGEGGARERRGRSEEAREGGEEDTYCTVTSVFYMRDLFARLFTVVKFECNVFF